MLKSSPAATMRATSELRSGLACHVHQGARVRGTPRVHLFLLLLVLACRGNLPARKSFPLLERYSAPPAVKTDLLQMQIDDGQWTMPGKDYTSWRFSGLSQINASNVKDLREVLVGNSGGEFGVRGALTALDTETGKQIWKAYSTGPDPDCLIGPNFHPFYSPDHGKDLGVKTWPPDLWKIGGGTAWGWI